MTDMRITVERTQRLESSRNGNPRWAFTTAGGMVHVTAPDIADAYVISDGFTGALDIECGSDGLVRRITRGSE